MRYTVVLERDPSGLVVAHVPTLRGCVSQGKTKREAMRNIKEAISLYIETLIEHGQSVPVETGREMVELSVVGK
ncbi:MAG: type II toxin-antitoxin system HicB family antitoxin [Phycisphaerales bacterium]|nr:type II toxin-antitoxin system HicB family antitoxin [Phycisphaerales bacterium]